jgi:hypothetical protein
MVWKRRIAGDRDQQHGHLVRVFVAFLSICPAFADAVDVSFDVRVGLDVEPHLRAIDEKLAIVSHRVIVAVDPCRDGLRYADAEIRIVWVGVLDMQDLVRFECMHLAVEGEFVVADRVGE